MPAPRILGMYCASQAIRSAGSSMTCAPRRSESRRSGPSMVTVASPSCASMSVMTRRLAVAVVPSTGVRAGSASRMAPMRR